MYEPSLHVPLLVRWPGRIQPGSVSERFTLNVDYAPTFLTLAGVPVPASMQGRSLQPLLEGRPPADWRDAIYYRYYHDPGHHNTRSHMGVRTADHKLIYYWKKDAWELFDFRADPLERTNLIGHPAYADITESLKARMAALKTEFRDEDQFADSFPPPGVDGNFPDHGQLGRRNVAQAIQHSTPSP
jgi:arylsulfatase A-like enzyme